MKNKLQKISLALALLLAASCSLQRRVRELEKQRKSDIHYLEKQDQYLLLYIDGQIDKSDLEEMVKWNRQAWQQK